MMKEQKKPVIERELTMVQVSFHLNLYIYQDSFRRFVVDIGSVHNPEYDIDISAAIPKIADYGNIRIEPTIDQTLNAEG